MYIVRLIRNYLLYVAIATPQLTTYTTQLSAIPLDSKYRYLGTYTIVDIYAFNHLINRSIESATACLGTHSLPQSIRIRFMSKKIVAGQSVASTILDTLARAVPLTVLLLNFDALVAEPVSTLVWFLPFTVLSVLFPRALASSLKQTATTFATCLIFFTPGTYCLLVVMGAPFTTHVKETVLLSLHLSFMAFTEAVGLLGLSTKNWRPLMPAPDDLLQEKPSNFTKQSPSTWTGVEGAVWGTFVGAYLGAVPIPLDWDRDWQRWPVTIYVGACLGLCIGSTIQSIGKHIGTKYSWPIEGTAKKQK